jgi:sirohydrochlorin ferrochelatase
MAIRSGVIILFLCALTCVLSAGVLHGEEALGLVIVSHGSPSPEWNGPVLDLAEEVRENLLQMGGNPFKEVRVALMEFAEPSINTVVGDLESAGVDRIYVVPLFIAPSEHTLYDLPAILGLYSEKGMLEGLKSEGIAIVDADMRITIGPTPDSGDLLKEIMLDRVRELSPEGSDGGLVLLAHGSSSFEPIWRSLCTGIGSYICARTGIEFFDYAFVEVGQSMITEGAPVILSTAEEYGTAIVVGVYVSMGVENMARRSAIKLGMREIEAKDILAGENILFARRGLLPDPRVAEWIAATALEWEKGLGGNAE